MVKNKNKIKLIYYKIKFKMKKSQNNKQIKKLY
jgi:hypothetical protein